MSNARCTDTEQVNDDENNVSKDEQPSSIESHCRMSKKRKRGGGHVASKAGWEPFRIQARDCVSSLEA